jgi:hypothetical protein
MLKVVFPVLALAFLFSVTPAKADEGGPCVCKCTAPAGMLYQQSQESSDFFTQKFESGIKTVSACQAQTGSSCSGRVSPLEPTANVGSFASCDVPQALRQSFE